MTIYSEIYHSIKEAVKDLPPEEGRRAAHAAWRLYSRTQMPLIWNPTSRTFSVAPQRLRA